MLHYGLGVRLGVADLLPLLPPPVRCLRALLALCPSLCLPKCPQQWMQCFHAQEYLLRFPKCRSEATWNCIVSGSALTKSDSLVLSSCSWKSVSGDAKPARQKHLSMVCSWTLFKALLIHRMASKTVADFANSVAVLNFLYDSNTEKRSSKTRHNDLLHLTGLKYYHGQYRQV